MKIMELQRTAFYTAFTFAELLENEQMLVSVPLNILVAGNDFFKI